MERVRLTLMAKGQYELFRLANGGYLLRYTPGSPNAVGTFIPSGAAPLETEIASDDSTVIDGSASEEELQQRLAG